MRYRRLLSEESRGGRKGVGILGLLAVCAALTGPSSAGAATGYELPPSSWRSLDPDAIAHGLAVDQTSRRLYAALFTTEGSSLAPGKLIRFESNGSGAGTFGAGEDTYYTGVAVNPVTQAFYGAEARLDTPLGSFGTAQLTPFSSAGVAGTPFPLSNTATLPQIATDSSGRIFYPNALTDTVQIFNAGGAVLNTINCSACTGGAFGQPVSVALNSEDDLYVVDLAPDRVVKFTLSGGGSYVFDSVLQSGRGAGAVAVDPSSDEVFVGDLPGGRRYHIVAYDSSGNQFDDFGAGLFTDPDPRIGAIIAMQIAVDATSHDLYVGDLGKIYVFKRVTIGPPTVTTGSAGPIGQVVATLNATVNAEGHAVLDCDFEWVDDAEFQATGFTSPSTLPCSQLPDGTSNVALKTNAPALTPATQYHFRLTATSNGGSTTGSVSTFTTLPSVAPTVVTDPATGVGETAATLVGRANPHGGSVSSCRFEFGASTAYGQNLPCKTNMGSASSEVTQKLEAKGLAAATTYHYRLVVTSNAGTTQGGDVAFTTTAPPPPPPPDPEPPPPAPEAIPPPPAPPAPLPLTCRAGYVKVRLAGRPICAKKCRKGFVRKTVGGKSKCVRRKARARATRRQPARASRR